MKKKVLLSSIATIALCLCLIAGSTFALFTDSTNFNIAVTSGDVEIEAYATINSVWSAYGEGVTEAGDEYLIDENGHNYQHGKRDPIDGRYIFANGGEAVIDGSNLKINRITPGDRVDIDINVTNKSDVAMVYRYKLEAENTNLATGMVVTVDEVSYEGMASWTSKWYPVIYAPDGEPADIPVKTISVELPVYAGNEYQSEKTAQEDGRPAGEQTVEYTITVEAVQGNAVTDDESQVSYFASDAQDIQEMIKSDVTDLTLLGDMDVSELNGIVGGTGIDVAEGKELVIDGKGNTIFVNHTAFNNSDAGQLEGLKGNTSIKFVNVVFQAENAGAGYAVCTGFDFTGTVEFENCTFKDLYAAVCMNPNNTGTTSTLVIKDCVYTNTTWGYSVDTSGANKPYDQQVTVTFEGNTGIADANIRENTWEQ